jgi:hypothetical protein
MSEASDEAYPDAAVLMALAQFRDLTDAQQRQFKARLRSPGQEFGLRVRALRARRRNERVDQLVSTWYAAGVSPGKVDWVAVRKYVDPDHTVTLSSLRRSYRRWKKSRAGRAVPSSPFPLCVGIEPPAAPDAK